MQYRVLICDDEPPMRRMLADCLTADDWEVVGQARDGQEAIELYLALRPDVVTMDIVMPGADGIYALERILEIDPQARVVMLSALSQSRLVMEATRKGACDFIAKPFLVEHLEETLRMALAEPAGV